MRLKIDENLPIDVADALRAAGHDVHSVYDESLAGADDGKLAAVARQERRGFITLDLDFADIRAYPLILKSVTRFRPCSSGSASP